MKFIEHALYLKHKSTLLQDAAHGQIDRAFLSRVEKNNKHVRYLPVLPGMAKVVGNSTLTREQQAYGTWHD